jgi:hypothetical protein
MPSRLPWFLLLRRLRRSIVPLAAVAVLIVASTVGCSSTTEAPPAGCADDRCAPGNRCLPLNGETKCRKTCSSNIDPAAGCPFGYTCVAPDTGGEPFCLQDDAKLEDGTYVKRSDNGQWGAPCNPTGGINNDACDGAQGFLCYATSPTDGAAYCTRFGCEADRNCGAGFGCATVNTTPNAERAKRSTIGEVQQVCLRRAYCSTCAADLDCPPVEGRPAHCIPDDDGKTFCSVECGTSKNCTSEAFCADLGAGYKTCYPRARRCVGDGSLCSPCRSDADCGEDGACVKGEYTTERTCAKKSASSCNEGKGRGSCPASVELESKVSVACAGGLFEQIPKDYCHGLYKFGEGADVGCYTPAR